MFMAKKILKENYITIVCLILLIILFSLIMRSSLHDKIIQFDYKIFDLLTKITTEKFTDFLRILTNFGDFYIPFGILVCIFIFLKNKWVIVLQSGCYAVSGIITYISKLLAGRPRPIDSLANIPKSYSFPSGHTLTSIVFYFMLIYLLTYKLEKKKRIIILTITLLLTLSIPFSRVYLRVHYFSDVLGGLIIGSICLLLFTNIISKNFGDKL